MPPGRRCLISGDTAEVVLVAGLNYRNGTACGCAPSNQPSSHLGPAWVLSLTTVYSAAANSGAANLAGTSQQDTLQAQREQNCHVLEFTPNSPWCRLNHSYRCCIQQGRRARPTTRPPPSFPFLSLRYIPAWPSHPWKWAILTLHLSCCPAHCTDAETEGLQGYSSPRSH